METKYKKGDRVMYSRTCMATVAKVLKNDIVWIIRDDGEKGAGDHGGWVTTGDRIKIIDEGKERNKEIIDEMSKNAEALLKKWTKKNKKLVVRRKNAKV